MLFPPCCVCWKNYPEREKNAAKRIITHRNSSLVRQSPLNNFSICVTLSSQRFLHNIIEEFQVWTCLLHRLQDTTTLCTREASSRYAFVPMLSSVLNFVLVHSVTLSLPFFTNGHISTTMKSLDVSKVAMYSYGLDPTIDQHVIVLLHQLWNTDDRQKHHFKYMTLVPYLGSNENIHIFNGKASTTRL